MVRTEATALPVLEMVILLGGKRISCGQCRRECRGQEEGRAAGPELDRARQKLLLSHSSGGWSSEDRCDTGHFPTTIAAAFHPARTLAVHLALVSAEAKRSQRKVHLGAGARLFIGHMADGGAAGAAALEIVRAFSIRIALLRTVQVLL